MAQPADLDKWARDQGFPQLINVAAKQTSLFDPYYNCIAYAFGDLTEWWWPTGLALGGHDANGMYWPIASDNRTKMQAFLDWFQHDGWTQTPSDVFVPQMRRVARYARQGQPTHAARQIGPDLWSSNAPLAV